MIANGSTAGAATTEIPNDPCLYRGTTKPTPRPHPIWSMLHPIDLEQDGSSSSSISSSLARDLAWNGRVISITLVVFCFPEQQSGHLLALFVL
uniref:Uncharacterized protein n=1 Tax=Anopheles albimanus TaxID=7167 RepID=A0A182F203_ANOAL